MTDHPSVVRTHSDPFLQKKNQPIRDQMEHHHGREHPEFDPTLAAVQAYAERDYWYDSSRSVPASGEPGAANGGVAVETDAPGEVEAPNPPSASLYDHAGNAYDDGPYRTGPMGFGQDPLDDELLAFQQKRRSRIALSMGACSAALVGGAALTSTVWWAGNRRGESLVEHQTLMAPPKDLDDICSIQNTSTDQGHKECEGVCAKAACCLAAGSKSCFLDHEETCGLYAPCSILHSDVGGLSSDTAQKLFIPPPPSDLITTCSGASLATVNGFIACQSACHPGRCCMTTGPEKALPQPQFGVPSCLESHQEVCLNYAPCSILGGAGLENTENEVNFKCAKHMVQTEEGWNACDDICKARSCCFASSEKRNCRAGNKEWCQGYQACEVLLVDTASDGSSVESMEENCKQSRIITHGDLVQCEEVCKSSLCCFYDDIECDTLFDIAECKNYEFCRHIVPNIYAPHSGTDPINESMETSGAWETEYGSGVDDGGTNTGVVVSNLPSTDELGTVDGSSSTIGSAGGSNSQVYIDRIQDICSFEKIAIEGDGTRCAELCSPFLCCFDYSSAGCSDSPDCFEYQACEFLVEGTLSQATGGQNTAEAIQDEVNKACALESILVPGGEAACRTLCMPFKCCFEGLCPNREGICNQYGGCEVLFSSHISGQTSEMETGEPQFQKPSSDLEIFCNPSSIDEDDNRFNCEETCRTGLCCTGESGDCSVFPSFCRQFAPCKIVWEQPEVYDKK